MADAGALRSVLLQKSQGRPGQSYDHVQKLGEGAFGVAHLVRDRRSSLLRVLKTINKRQAQVPPGQLEKEIRNLKACDHPHIVRLFEYYEDYENIYLVMEHAEGGELHQVLESEKQRGFRLPERWVATVVKQCLMAVAHVHLQGIIHKDLKSENILLLHKVDPQDPQQMPHAVIIDLGIADVFSARLGRRARCTVVAGTPTHMAPEVWRGNFGPVADVWSLGVVMFELLAGEIPFMCSSLNTPQEWLRQHKQGPNWSLLNHVSKQARAINQRMLNWDERMRPTAQQCLGHSWFKEPSAAEPGFPPEEGAVGLEDAEAEDPGKAADSLQPPLTARQNPSEVVIRALGDYMGKSRFEKAVLMQVASVCHLAQMSQISQVFVAADHDNDGTVSREELGQALLRLGVDAGDAESYVACVDVDANGRVDYTELAAGCVGLLYESLRGLLWQSFCIWDVDGNGMLSRDEIVAVLTRTELSQYGFPSPEASGAVQEALGRMDVDSDGQISFEELCRVFIPRPVFDSQGQDGSGGPHGPYSGRSAGTSGRRGKAMHDEEFAQLLDQIEADHAAEQPDAAGGGGPEAGSMGAHNRAPAGAGVARAGIGGVGHKQSYDGELDTIELTAHLAAVGFTASEPRGAPPEGPAQAAAVPQANAHHDRRSVEEELSSLLADIADGP